MAITTFSEFWYSNIEASHATTYVKFGSIEREDLILFIWTQNFAVQIWVIWAKSPQNLVFNTSFLCFSSLLRTRFDFQKIVMFQWVSSRKFCWKTGMLQRHRAKRSSDKKRRFSRHHFGRSVQKIGKFVRYPEQTEFRSSGREWCGAKSVIC